MKALTILLLLLPAAISCSRPQPESSAPAAAAVPQSHSLTAQGEPYGLRFENGGLLFCDARGGRRLDLKTGQDVASAHDCVRNEGNTACAGIEVEASVRSPRGEADDIVDAGGKSFPVEGRVHDCAAEGEAISVVTGSGVVLIDVKTEKKKLLSARGGGRVAIGAGWIAWTEDTALRAVVRPVLP